VPPSPDRSVDADTEFTLAHFQGHLRSVRADLAHRGVPAIAVGGTGLYQRVVVDDLAVPGAWPEIRSELEAQVASSGVAVAHARLAELDPVAAARMEPTNARRVVRALEVTLGSGRRFSSFGPGIDAYPSSEVIQIGLRWDRQHLARRVESRVRAMIDAGWLDEVRALDGRWSRTAGQAVGYAQLLAVIRNGRGLEDAIDEIVTRTRQLAVRQERWFRRDPRIRWVDVIDDPATEALPAVLEALDAACELHAVHPDRQTP